MLYTCMKCWGEEVSHRGHNTEKNTNKRISLLVSVTADIQVECSVCKTPVWDRSALQISEFLGFLNIHIDFNILEFWFRDAQPIQGKSWTGQVYRR